MKIRSEEMAKILRGHIVYADTPSSFRVFEGGYLIYDNNRIVSVSQNLPRDYEGLEVEDLGDVLIVPGFYDLHTHGGQYPQCGVGMSHQLLHWLKDYTYTLEMKFEDGNFARRIYTEFANELVKYGTLGAAVFGTTSLRGTDILFQEFINRGLRGYIGKVCMECCAPDFITKDHVTNIGDVIELENKYSHQKMVKSIVTPRFAPTSTAESLEELGRIAQAYNLAVQSHLDENVDEIEWVHELYGPDAYAKVYDNYGLYGQQPTLMAHGIYLTDEEVALTRDRGVILVHCPDSNLNLGSGIMPVRKYLSLGITVALGTDIAGGHKISMAEALVRCIQLSKLVSMEQPEYKSLSFCEAYYMGTVVGGSFFGLVGKLEKDYQMDCLVIDDPDLYKELYSLEDRLEKFVYTGDDRWISRRYIAGKQV